MTNPPRPKPECANAIEIVAQAIQSEHHDYKPERSDYLRMAKAAIDAFVSMDDSPFHPAQQAPAGEWRCFHCGEVFTDPKEAANHFSVDHAGSETLCQLAQVDGGIARVIADLAEELQRYRSEDNTSYREFYALGADHRTALIREEQKGYDRGLADGCALAGAHPQKVEGEERSLFGSMRAQWTFDPDARAYYFAPMQAAPPPYNTREVKAIIDIANDGTLAGVEIVEFETPLPEPPRLQEASEKGGA